MRGMPIGYTESGKLIRYEITRDGRRRPGESSGIVFGPARSGKTSVACGPLYEFEGSMVVPDVKAQFACIFAGHRKQRLGQEVVLIRIR